MTALLFCFHHDQCLHMESNGEEEPYLLLFREHLSQFRAHLAGTGRHALSSSFVPPAGYWTAAEKETFFHALSVHSSLRPDLIARQLAHKTELDVSTYIDALAAAALDENDDDGARRAIMPIAMDVSDDWVDVEETQAARFSAIQDEWEAAERVRLRDASISDHEGQTDFVTWEANFLAEWNRQNTFASIARTALRVLARGLKKNDLDTAPITLPTKEGAPPAAHVPPSDSVPTGNIPIDDIPIDPVLLSASGPSPRTIVTAPPAPQLPSPTPEDSPLDSALSPKSQLRHDKRMYMRRKRAAERGTEEAEIQTGRKHKRARPDSPSDSEDADGDETNLPKKAKKASKSQKFEAYMSEAGVDSEVLEHTRMHMFNLMGISRMMESVFLRSLGVISSDTAQVVSHGLLGF